MISEYKEYLSPIKVYIPLTDTEYKIANVHVEIGDKVLVKAGEIAIDSSNGIDIIAYPQSEFNIGFTLDGKSKNPGAGRFHNAPKRQ